MFHLRLLWHAIRFPFGITLIILGLAGILLPLLPGTGPLILGILCVGPHSRVVRWLRRRLPPSFHRFIPFTRASPHDPPPKQP